MKSMKGENGNGNSQRALYLRYGKGRGTRSDQIVIPREARDKFDIKAGDTLIVLGDEKWGIAVTKSDVLQKFAAEVYKKIEDSTNE